MRPRGAAQGWPSLATALRRHAHCKPQGSISGRVRPETFARPTQRKTGKQQMLFHTHLFIFAFLPVALAAFYIAAKVNKRLPIFVLIAASLIFYAYWMPEVTLLLLGSIVFNYLAGLFLQSDRPKATRRLAIIAAIAIDLGLLAYFKYANFFMGTLHSLTGLGPGPLDIILPIGISFYTFTQIAYLVDSYKGEVKERSFSSYVLFVTFFPHLIAGPVLHHQEMMPQFADPNTYRFNWLRITLGVLLFAIGLWKKVVFADTIAPWANETFNARRRRRHSGILHGLGRLACLHAADLLRLLGLFGHGRRPWPDVRHRPADQLRLALSLAVDRRFLAPLAHDAQPLPARLSLHSAGRKP